MKRILIAEPEDFSARARQSLETVAHVDLIEWSTRDLPRAFEEYDAVWIRLGYRITREDLAGSLRCRYLVCAVTGLDHIDLEACADHDIEVLSLRGETDFLRGRRATAEMTLALALALIRRIPAASSAVLNGGWDRDRFRGHELFGKTAAIIGVGRLGSIVAGYLQALGMSVIGYDVRSDFPEGVQRASSLQELLSTADLVTVHVGLDESTRGLIGHEELASMRPGAVLINTSRGAVIDERALLTALTSGGIAGAALDVIDGEPDVGTNALVAYARTNENLLIVPHIGGCTVESFDATERFLADKLLVALARLGP
jgi:D-3-phosphoglycerate dehydrogenase